MADGTAKPIEQVALGDFVLASDPLSGETAAEEVTDVITGAGIKHLVEVGIDNNHDEKFGWITATSGHPFWVQGAGWTKAGQLAVGDMLTNATGDSAVVTSLKASIMVGSVYNLTVDRLHTYYVMADGQDSVLVHNCSDASLAKGLGYNPSGKGSKNPIFKRSKGGKGPMYISRDRDSHSGGYWKGAKTAKALERKATRSGTYSRDLKTRIGD